MTSIRDVDRYSDVLFRMCISPFFILFFPINTYGLGGFSASLTWLLLTFLYNEVYVDDVDE